MSAFTDTLKRIATRYVEAMAYADPTGLAWSPTPVAAEWGQPAASGRRTSSSRCAAVVPSAVAASTAAGSASRTPV